MPYNYNYRAFTDFSSGQVPGLDPGPPLPKGGITSLDQPDLNILHSSYYVVLNASTQYFHPNIFNY